MIRLTVNGSGREVPEGQTLLRLLDSLGLPAPRVAVERNGEIVPRDLYPETALAEGDRIEIVQFVGGG
jgi:thiamine biosynthesis protein ThiS